ncbi:MAG: hypothetical protein ACLR7U_06520 [Ruthenibacterium lactatiformans]
MIQEKETKGPGARRRCWRRILLCAFGELCRRRRQLRGEQNSASSSVRRKRAFAAAPQETVSGASSSCLPSNRRRMRRKRWGRGILPAYRIARRSRILFGLCADGTFMFMCNVYQGMTTGLGTWSYESGVLTLDAPARRDYVFFAQDADTLLMHSGDR